MVLAPAAFAPPVRPASAAWPRAAVCGPRHAPAWVASSAASGGEGNQGTLPGGYSPAEHSKKRIRWTDRVALQAQVGSAVDTLEVILDALRDNKTREDVGLPGDTRFRDEGLEALYAFANFDVWSLRTDFFGRALDLGQFERFKTVFVLPPFAITVGDCEYRVLSVLAPAPGRARVRVLYSKPRIDDAVFCIDMSRPAGCWMVDSFRHDPAGTEPAADQLSGDKSSSAADGSDGSCE
jgi:hypothetical protein